MSGVFVAQGTMEILYGSLINHYDNWKLCSRLLDDAEKHKSEKDKVWLAHIGTLVLNS